MQNVPFAFVQPISDTFAGWADHLTGGVTQQIREALRYDDAVDKNSREYENGGNIGDVHGVALAAFGGGGALRGGSGLGRSSAVGRGGGRIPEFPAPWE